MAKFDAEIEELEAKIKATEMEIENSLVGKEETVSYEYIFTNMKHQY